MQDGIAVPLTLRDANANIYLPAMQELRDKLLAMAEEWKDVPMLAHTHGQPASPTHLGKEIYVFVERIDNQINNLKNIPFCAICGQSTMYPLKANGRKVYLIIE